jgi:NOT2 / NOT3 / NOT5 family
VRPKISADKEFDYTLTADASQCLWTAQNKPNKRESVKSAYLYVIIGRADPFSRIALPSVFKTPNLAPVITFEGLDKRFHLLGFWSTFRQPEAVAGSASRLRAGEKFRVLPSIHRLGIVTTPEGLGRRTCPKATLFGNSKQQMRPGVTNIGGPPAPGAAQGTPDIMSLLTKAATIGQQQQVAAAAARGGYAAAAAGLPVGAIGGTALPGVQQQAQPPPQATPIAAGVQQQPQPQPSIGPDGYGILGLLGVIRTPDRDLNVLALGTDLTTLNLNLNTAEPLHASFAHPWTDAPATKEPALTLPSSYRVPQPALKTGHFSKFSVGTLIYIFYSMPRDVLQAYAAQELYNREWRFHRDTKLWFRKESMTVAPAAGSAAAAAAAGTSEYVYWDVSVWEKRPFAGPLPALVAGFLPEEEVRIRPPTAAAPAAGAPAPATGGAGGAPTAAATS